MSLLNFAITEIRVHVKNLYGFVKMEEKELLI